MDIYGAVRKEKGEKGLVPQLYQGQYIDEETGLAYNRFRYYDNESGGYISQDPIGLMGSNPTFYGYVKDTNTWIDSIGLNPFGIPGINEFGDWFNNMTSSQFDNLWSNKEAAKIIKSRLRHPGKLHEWHLVSRADTFKRWGVTFEQIRDLRTAISDVNFTNPVGRHGGVGSTKAHNELLGIIDSSLDYDTFVRRLNNWANYRLKGGVNDLPDGLQRTHH